MRATAICSTNSSTATATSAMTHTVVLIRIGRACSAIVQAVAQEIGADRVGVRLTPMGRFMGMGDDTPIETFTYIVESLNRYGLAYLHLVEPAVVGTVKDENFDPRWDEIILKLRDAWNGVLIIAGGYDAASAEKAIREGRADVVAFGRPFWPTRIYHAGFEMDWNSIHLIRPPSSVATNAATSTTPYTRNLIDRLAGCPSQFCTVPIVPDFETVKSKVFILLPSWPEFMISPSKATSANFKIRSNQMNSLKIPLQ